MSLNPLSITSKEIALKLVIFKTPGEVMLKTIEDKVLVQGKQSKEYRLEGLEAGWYKVQAFAYLNNRLISVSGIKEIYVGEKVVIPESSLPLQVEKKIEKPMSTLFIAPILYSISFLLILIALILFLTRKNKKDEIG